MRVLGHVRRSVLTGILIILPTVVTLWLVSLILRPVNRFATPVVMGLMRAAGLGALLDFPGAMGRRYQLQRTTDLTRPDGWVDVGAPFTGDGSTRMLLDDTVPPTAGQAYYRIKILP